MNYNSCPLYSLSSKRVLKHLLGIDDNRLLKQAYVATLVEPYIDCTRKPRLIEPPKPELKSIQRRIKGMLYTLPVPDYVFSGIRGRSYADNAFFHARNGASFLFKVDLTAFFPSISRELVYDFFRDDLNCSPDIAEILTNFTTIDIEKSHSRNLPSVKDFLAQKGVTCYNHLISGAPTSQLLSYLVNRRMFDELHMLATKQGIAMTIYVDDITFSSRNRISGRFRTSVLRIIQKHNYHVSQRKTKNYTRHYPKLVTGVIIDANGNPTIKNALRKKIADEHKHLRQCPNDSISRRRLQGLVTATRQVKKTAYPIIRKFAFENSQNENTDSGLSG